MNQPSREPEYLVDSKQKQGLRVVISPDTIQRLLDLEVDLVVMSKELSKLEDFCIRIGEDLHTVRVLPLDMALAEDC